KDTFRLLNPGFTFGGPIKKDRLWFFLGFAPFEHSLDRTVNFAPASCNPGCAEGTQTFHLKNWQYYSTARLDANLTQKVRVFGSWLYQFERETGSTLPSADPIPSEAGTFLNSGTVGYANEGINTFFAQYSPSHGWSQPNATYNVGADLTLTPKIVATTRFGYFFTNYHDFGWPTTGANLSWNLSGIGATANCTPQPCTPSAPHPT